MYHWNGFLTGTHLKEDRVLPDWSYGWENLGGSTRRGRARTDFESLVVHGERDYVSELGPLPSHVRDLFEKTTSNLMPCQRDAIHALLYHYADIFSQGLQDLGQSDLVKHRIDTGDAHPTRQAPRRLQEGGSAEMHSRPASAGPN